jgi:predicted AlkP superfamily pyrophosphatase or phosphodiesterase
VNRKRTFRRGIKGIRNPILFVFCTLLIISAAAQSDTTQKIVANRTNAPDQQAKPYVILISADGFRSDFASKYNARNLLHLSQQGMSAKYMIASYPTLTFPNHYSQVTGLYPSHHGLVNNTFYDSKSRVLYNKNNRKFSEDGTWYGGTPLWVLAEQQKMLAASFYWVGSEAAIQGVRPTYYYTYNEQIPLKKRLQVVKRWLQLPAEQRPHLITFYFPEVDQAAHNYGPDSPETGKAVKLVDEAIGTLNAMADSLHLQVDFIFVSDHGMAKVDSEHPLPLPSALDTATCVIVPGATQLHVFVKNKDNISSLFQKLKAGAKDYDVYLAEEIPLAWHYGKKDDRYNRIGDILIVPHFPKVFKLNNWPIKPGNHGFDPSQETMHATFYAWGPQFKKSMSMPPFENVNVYPLVAHILGLTYSDTIDGNLEVLTPILK